MPMVISLPEEKQAQYIGKGNNANLILRDPSKEQIAEAFIRMASGRMFQVCFRRRKPKPGYPMERVMLARMGVKKYVKGKVKDRKQADRNLGLLTVFEMGGEFEAGCTVALNKVGLERCNSNSRAVLKEKIGRIVSIKDQIAQVYFSGYRMFEIRLEHLKKVAYRRISLDSLIWAKVDGKMIYFKDAQVVQKVYTTVVTQYVI